MNAKETKLIKQYNKWPEDIAAALIAAGWHPPEEPKAVDLVEEEAKRIRALPDCGSCAKDIRDGVSIPCMPCLREIARDNLKRLCDAEIAGVKARCAIGCDGPCTCATGKNVNATYMQLMNNCGGLQRQIRAKYGQEAT